MPGRHPPNMSYNLARQILGHCMAIAAMENLASAPRPPYRADHVGSLLRPDRLKQAREQFLGAHTSDRNLGPHDDTRLRAVEDACIREALAMQERAGLQLATDGE